MTIFIVCLTIVICVALLEFFSLLHYGEFIGNSKDCEPLKEIFNRAKEVEVLNKKEITIYYFPNEFSRYGLLTINKTQLPFSKYNIRIHAYIGARSKTYRVFRGSDVEDLIEKHFNKWQRRDKEMPDGKQVRIVG